MTLRSLLALALLAPALCANQVVLAPQCSVELRLNQVMCNIAIDRNDGEPPDVHNSLAVRFDLASTIPAGSTIQSARITGRVTWFNMGGAFGMHEILTPACTAQWSGPTSGRGAPSGPALAFWDYTTHPIFAAPAFTVLVQRWTDFPSQNLGLLFAAYDPFDSAICEMCFDQLQLVIDFTPPCPPPVSYCIAAPNSQGPNGAHLSITGSTSLAQNDLVLVASGVRAGAPGFFYFGATQQQIPLGNGYSCAGTPLFRLAAPNLFADASGVLRRPVNFTVGSALNIQPGSVWNFQAKYRDVPGGGAGYNFTDGLQLTFCP